MRDRVVTRLVRLYLDNTLCIGYNVDAMYLRVTKRKRKDGSAVEYVQLAHNYRDPKTGFARPEVLYTFGRKDELDLDALRRLVRSICRFLEPGEVEEIQRQLGEEWAFEFLGARQLGGAWFLDKLWHKLRIGATLDRLLQSRNYRRPIERLIFAMVANRALNPSSKLAMERWVANEVLIDGLPEVEVHQLYQAMDFLLEASETIQHDVFFSVANLFNLEVDLIFLDTTTTYFEIEGEDEDTCAEGGAVSEKGLRKRSKNDKDNHPELAHVLIAFAVTRTGIPVRCWVWPGDESDQNLVEEVKRDLNGWRMGRVVLVTDAGFNSEKNRRILQGAGGHYIVGEKMRQGQRGLPVDALKRPGTYKTLDNGLKIKEVVVGEGEARRRFIVAINPVEAERERKKREDIVREVERRLNELKQLDGEPHTKAACALRSHPVYGRYIRQTKGGKLRLNKAKIRSEAHFDGKFLISTSDDTLSAEDAVMGYKQLAEIERVFRDLKHTIDIRPVFHRLPDRIRAHVLLCWLAMLLIRIAEQETEETWWSILTTLQPLQMGICRTASGEVWQSSPVTKAQHELFTKLSLKPPPKYYKLPTPRSCQG